MKIEFGNRSVDLIEDGDRICVGLSEGKSFEPQSREWWASTLYDARRYGPKIVLDVGSYSGVYAMAAAQLGHDVIAFEPLPENTSRVIANVRRNQGPGWGGVDVQGVAVSDQDGEGTFLYNSGVPYTTGGSLIPDKKERTRLKVRTVKLDSIVPKTSQVVAMKIDVERGEPAVLRGARELIKAWQPAILLEILDLPSLLAVEEALPGYHRAMNIDRRNFIYLPREG